MAKSSTTFKDVNQNEALKNLVIVLGITILLVAGVIGAGLIISRVSENSESTPDEIIASDTEEGSVNVADDGEVTAETPPDEEPPEDTSFLESDEIVFEDVTEQPLDEIEAEENTPAASSELAINQTANPGDSFSWLSRRAMYQYLGERGLGLDVGGRLYFEVTLTNMVSTGVLNAGQTVEFKVSDLDKVFFSASNLDPATHSAWIHQAENSYYL